MRRSAVSILPELYSAGKAATAKGLKDRAWLAGLLSALWPPLLDALHKARGPPLALPPPCFGDYPCGGAGGRGFLSQPRVCALRAQGPACSVTARAPAATAPRFVACSLGENI